MRLLSGLLACAAFVPFVFAQTELPAIPADLTTPVQQRLAFNGPMSMRIGWSTFQQLEQPTVYFGQSPHAMFRSASSQSSTTYPTSRTWSNTVTLTMLKPYTTYYYKIVSTNSTIGSFKTARAAGDHTPFTMAGVVDMGVFGPDGLSTRQMSYTGKAVVNSLNRGITRPSRPSSPPRPSMNSSYTPVISRLTRTDAELNLGYINGTQAQGPQIYEGLLEQFLLQSVHGHRWQPRVQLPERQVPRRGRRVPWATNFTGFINRYAELMPETPRTTLGHRPRFDTGLEGAHMKARAAAASTSGALSPFWYSFDYGMTH
ncbi:purple acid phosphatase-like protein, partial [Mycena latifolia]